MNEQSTGRKPISKSKRFDIFHRDGFTCQYCGRRPPDTILELDHILACARGGDNDLMNLVTSCEDCNRGKSDKILGQVQPTPDADVQYLKAEQEAAEYHRYLQASEARENTQQRVIGRIQELWCLAFNMDDCPADRVIKGWLTRYQPADIERAIECAIPAFMRNQIGPWKFDGMLRYVGAVLRNQNAGVDS